MKDYENLKLFTDIEKTFGPPNEIVVLIPYSFMNIHARLHPL